MVQPNYISQDAVYGQLRTTKEFQDSVRRRAAQDYSEFLSSEYWHDVRSLVLCRDARCTSCGSTTRLEVHHKTYAHRGDELRHLDDMTTLCSDCHRLVHAARAV